MSAFKRYEVTQSMVDTGIVPVFYHPDPETAQAVLQACYDGGIRVFEFTNRGEGAHKVFESLLAYSRQHLPDLKLGIGSLVDPVTTGMYIQMGADFIVSPILNPEMAKICNRRKVLWSPGCGSLSEISQAEELGAETVKIFPASQVGGPSFVKAALSPMPWSMIMPTGGVAPTEENLKGWFEAGVVCVGMGSKLVTKALLAEQDWTSLTETARKAIAIAQSYSKFYRA